MRSKENKQASGDKPGQSRQLNIRILKARTKDTHTHPYGSGSVKVFDADVLIR